MDLYKNGDGVPQMDEYLPGLKFPHAVVEKVWALSQMFNM